jgi:O-antigen ligase
MSRPEGWYRLGWALTLFGMPLSNPVMSLGLFVFAAAWLFDRWRGGEAVQPSKGLLAGVLGLAIVQLMALLWSEDVGAGVRLLKNEGPFFAFVLLAATGRWDREWAGRWAPRMLGGAVLVASIAMWSYGWWRESQGEFLRARDWSPFISHVRFSLLVAWAAGWWTLLALQGRMPPLAVVVLVAVGGATVARTGSVTGALLLPVAVGGAVWLEARSWVVRGLLAGGAGGVLVVAGVAVWHLRAQYPDPAGLENHTPYGGVYTHALDKSLQENGTFVWTYVCAQELDSAWLARTGRPLAGSDGRGQDLRTTAIRHLSSLGLRKDADGVAALSDASIAHIFQGIPTVSELQHRGLRRRWDVLAFEWANRRDGGDPSGNSVVQRIEFARAAVWVVVHYPWIGVGTGDVEPGLAHAYDEVNSPLDPEFRLRPHNQYLTLLVEAGPMALFAWLVALASVWKLPGTWTSAARMFILLLAVSCLTEDTLETQAGATFAGVFMGFFAGAAAAGRPLRPLEPPDRPREPHP